MTKIMNRMTMFLYVVFYTIVVMPIGIFCEFRKKAFPNFLNKFCSKIESKFGL